MDTLELTMQQHMAPVDQQPVLTQVVQQPEPHLILVQALLMYQAAQPTGHSLEEPTIPIRMVQQQL